MALWKPSRRLFLAGAGLIAAPAIVRAQSPQIRQLMLQQIPATTSSLDPQTQLWSNAVNALNGNRPSPTELGRVDTLIKAYKATTGLFALLSREWLFAVEMVDSAKIDIIGLQPMTLNSAPTFTAIGSGAAGYDGGGTGWIDTGFTSDANFTTNSGSFGASVSTSNVVGANSKTVMGANTALHYFGPYNAANNTEWDFGAGTFPSTSNLDSDHRGVYLFNRTGSLTLEFYKNARTVVSKATTAQTLPTKKFFICGGNDGFDALNNAYTGKISSAFFGGAMNSAQAAAKNAALAAYIAAVGA